MNDGVDTDVPIAQAHRPAPGRYRHPYRAAVIGHTGRGNYGHGLDTVFTGMPGVTLVGVADPDDDGRAMAMARSGGCAGYLDYREMLASLRPDVVSIAPRHPDQREAMFRSAVAAGVRAIYCEKPLAASLAEADRIVGMCATAGVRVAIAHQNRAFPAPYEAWRMVQAGAIGRVVALRASGKQDHRGGGQDLMILGTHMIDLMRLLAGDALWCNASVASGNAPSGRLDIREAAEAAGWIAGDCIHATYGFSGGMIGTYTSIVADDGGDASYFRMEIGGTGGRIVFWSSASSPVAWTSSPHETIGTPFPWTLTETIPLDPVHGGSQGSGANGPLHDANQFLVADLLEAVETGRKPRSCITDAQASLEMIMAAYASHFGASRITLPLRDRTHPLA